MVISLLNSVVLSGVERVLNRVLALDPLASKRLAAHQGRSVCVQCTAPRLTINITIVGREVMLTQGEGSGADTTITGSAFALSKLLLIRDTAGLHKNGITVSGNAALLNDLHAIAVDLDLDWEYPLSKILGDVPTQAISESITQAGDFARRTHESLLLDIDEYIHEEKRLFPTRDESTRFYESVDTLRLRMDRLQSRVNRLLHATASD